MKIRIEILPHCINLRHAELRERLVEFILDHLHSLKQGFQIIGFLRCGNRHREMIEHLKERGNRILQNIQTQILHFLRRALAEDLFDDERAMIRIDMSEYMEKHSVSRLVGAPPGYVGYDEGGQLTEAVRRRPYSVILFDEIEKAHHDVFNIFLQILDDGALTDSRGRHVDFKNTIIIMTSNLGSDILLDAAAKGKLEDAQVREEVMNLMKQNFRPEFLNRVDEILMFHALKLEDIERILMIQMGRFSERLAGLGVKVEMTDAASKHLAKEGYDPLYGARPLKRVIVKEIETPVSKLIVGGKLVEGSTLKIDVENESLKFSC